MPRIKSKRVRVAYQNYGLSNETHDMNLALTIVREMSPDVKVLRVVDKPNKPTVVEIRGSRDDIAQFQATYNLRKAERITRSNPTIPYDEFKLLMVSNETDEIEQ